MPEVVPRRAQEGQQVVAHAMQDHQEELEAAVAPCAVETL